MKNNIYSVIGMGSLFVIVQVIAIAITPLYSQAESEALGGKETIENPGFAFIYLGIILVFTFIILWIAKRKKEKFIKGLILAAIFMTMVYLFIPITVMAMYPSSDDGWGFNEIDTPVVVLNAGDVDDDGVVEIIAGCADNRIRVYESENHTLEWESEELNANITQILIANLDNDGAREIVVLSQEINIYDGSSGLVEYFNFSANFTAIATGDLNGNGTKELLYGTDEGRVIIIEAGIILNDIDLSQYLGSIDFLDTTDNGLIIAASQSNIIVINSDTLDIHLNIIEFEEIDVLTVYRNPNGEDYIVVSGEKSNYLTNVSIEELIGINSKFSNMFELLTEYYTIASGEKRVYVYNLSNDHHIRRDPNFDSFRDEDFKARAIYLEQYSIPGYSDSTPDVIVLGEKTIYISPDFMKNDKGFYFLRGFKYDLLSILSYDLEGDGEKELIVGFEDGYKYTSIRFGEGPDLLIPFIISILIALSLSLLVHKFPEWYVVDSVGLVMAIGATVILGVTFAILPAIVLLIILGIYDAISVYKTKHMISLADSVIELNLPVLLVIPKKLGYSYRKQKPRLKEQLESGTEREAMFMGLGDIVIPSLLIVSSLSFLPAAQSGIGIAGNILVSIGTMIGILVGFSILMRFVMKGNPQAGLPLLNSGAIIGYFVTYLLVFQDFGFGFNLNF